MTATTHFPPLMPVRGSRAATWVSVALAVAMHCLLFAFLYIGIRWQSRPPDAVQAELWSELPRPVAPAPTPASAPPKPVVSEEPRQEPAPPKPDIAIREEKKKPEPKKPEKPKAEIRKEEKPVPNDDPIRRALEKEELKRQLARDLQRDEMAQKAASDAAALGRRASDEWNDRVSAKVRAKIPFAVASLVAGNPEAIFEVNLLPGLEVGTVRRLKSSGNAAYDEAAERAITAASPLPAPASDRVAVPRLLILKMQPKDK